jgi:hypothetical protein
MKFFDVVATLVVVALFFVALLLSVLSPKADPPVAPVSARPEPVSVSEEPARPLSLCKTFLQAAIEGNFAAFKNACSKEGDGQMKLFSAQAGTKEMFRRAAETIGPACRQGYELEYLTAMNQQGSEVFLWKLVPQLGQTQFLVRLTLKGGKVSGFFFQ